MELPPDEAFDPIVAPVVLTIDHPGGVGGMLRDPDGGEWMRGRIEPTLPVAAEGRARHRFPDRQGAKDA